MDDNIIGNIIELEHLDGNISQIDHLSGNLNSSGDEQTVYRGYSAYEIALQQGFEGSKDEWLRALVGPQGETGVSISDVRLNPDFTLTITLDDGTEFTTDSIKGDKGDKGQKGDKGDKGDIGTGISFVRLNDDYTLTIIFSDGSDYKTHIPIRGEKGQQGVQGIQGPKGDTGERGPQGQQGIQGVQGPKGQTGQTGPQGETGPAFTYEDFTQAQLEGLRGPQGQTGPKGDKGQKGDTGQQGLKGDTGQKGEKGDTGSQGPKGDSGPKGDKGQQGIQGQTGAQGQKGETGDSGVYIGTDEPTDENIKVWISNDSSTDSGTVESLVSDVTDLKEDFNDINGVLFQTTDNLLDFTDASLWVRKDLDGVTRSYAVSTANKIPVTGGTTIYTALKDLPTDIFGTVFNIRLQQYDADGEKVGSVWTGSSITSTDTKHKALDASTTHIVVCLNTNNYQKTFTIAQLVEMNPLIYVGMNSAITNDAVYRHNVSTMDDVQSNISALQSDADSALAFVDSYHQTINLFNPSAVLNGKYMRTVNGELKYSLHSSYHTTDFIPVSAGDTLIASRDGVEIPAYSYAYFDTDKTWLGTLYGNVVLVNANPAPQDGYIRISFHDDYYDADRMMVEITTRNSASPFVPYGKVGITYDDLEPILSAVEDDLSIPIKELFKAEADDTAESVISAITSKAVVFSITTDEHYKDITADANTLTSMYRDSCRNIKYVNGKVKSDMVISLGDRNCDAEGEHDERLTAQAEMIKWLRSTNDKTFAIIGNHDFNGANYANVISDAELYAVTQRYNEDYVERDGITDNAFIDFPFAKVRAIFYNSFYNNGSAIVMSLGLTKNKTWLANVALDTPNDYAVVFMTHSPIKQGFGTDTIYGGTDVIGILNAYATQSTYTDSANGTVYDFTGKSGTKVACAICGHVHDDNVYRDSNLTFPFVCIGCGKFENGNPVSTIGTPTKPTRKRGTVSSDLWDTVVILPEEKKVKFIRFGAGEDREVTYD